MVDPDRREGDLKDRSLEYHKDAEDTSPRSAQKSDKDANNGGGNLDSGYHSFGCPSNCTNRNSEMITTTRGHDEDFPPPIPPRGVYSNGYRQPLDGGYVTKMHLHPDINAVAERGCNSLPDMALYRNSHSVVTVSSALRASDSNFHRRPQATHDTKAAEQEAADRTEELAEKIGFCFKLGFTAEQVKATLHKLGAQASKNDILMALGDFTSESASLPRVTFSENEQSLNESKAADGLRNVAGTVELIPRGPSTVEDDTKDEEANASENLRPIVIDGSNVAMSHGNKEYFSCKGIQLTVQYFHDRGHRDITVFVPKYRKEHTRPDAPIKDQEILTKLQEEKILVWTPSRHVAGRRITCYDDRFILKLAQETEGVIVSNDNFRDLQNEKPEWKEVIEKRLLMYSFVNDRFMLPDDPLGRNGPNLDNFLRIRQSTEEKRKQCPYGKKCTYGKKCKYYHPECSSSQRSVSDESRRRQPPSSAAKNLASEVMKDSALGQLSPQHGAQSKSPRKEGAEARVDDSRKENGIPRNLSQGEPRRTISPHAVGACGTTPTSNHQAVLHGATAAPPPTMQSLHSDFSNLKIAQPYGDYPKSGPYVPYPYSDSNSTGADGRTPNGVMPGPHQIHMPAPRLHREVGRNVASSTSPHQHMSQLSVQHHSSPSAIQMYDQASFLGRQANQSQPMFPNLTYPAQHPFPQYPPQQQYPQSYKPPMPQNERIAYHQAMLHHHQMMISQSLAHDPHLLTPQSNGPPMRMPPGYPPYVYPPTSQQHPVPPPMAPPSSVGLGGNLTAPHNLDPTMYEQASRQVYSSPNPVNPHPIMPRQPNSHGYKMPAIPQDQVSSPTPQHQFKNPSSPRYHLYRNLCGLFNRGTVERVLLSHPHESDAKKLAKMCLEMDN